MIPQYYCKEKLDAGHSWGLKDSYNRYIYSMINPGNVSLPSHISKLPSDLEGVLSS